MALKYEVYGVLKQRGVTFKLENGLYALAMKDKRTVRYSHYRSCVRVTSLHKPTEADAELIAECENIMKTTDKIIRMSDVDELPVWD